MTSDEKPDQIDKEKEYFNLGYHVFVDCAVYRRYTERKLPECLDPGIDCEMCPVYMIGKYGDAATAERLKSGMGADELKITVGQALLRIGSLRRGRYLSYTKE